LTRTHSAASTSPFDEKEDRGALLLAAFNRRRGKQQERPVLPTKSTKVATGSHSAKGRELNEITAAPHDEFYHDDKRNFNLNAKDVRLDKDTKNDLEQILRVCICVDPSCRDDDKCRPPHLLNDAKDLEKMIRDPSVFYLPVSLILRREAEMRESAKATKVPKSRWNGSLLYRKWQETQHKEQEQRHDTDSITTSSGTEVLTCVLHPVQTLAESQVVSPKFTWWQPWVTVCIRAYYNTGTIRIPAKCHGLEVLLALEFFDILYGTTDQLVFDDSKVYQKVKQWSHYFTYRAALAKWVVDTLEQRRLEEQEVQRQQQVSAINSSFRPPFVFCTHPKPVEPGWTLTIEPLQKPVLVFQGGLDLKEDDKEGNKARCKKRPTSEQLVHGFFVPSLKKGKPATPDTVYSDPEMVPGMMREDFKSYLQHVLPGVELTFAIKEVKLVSNRLVMGRNKKKYHGDAMRRAVLVLSFHPSSTKAFKPVFHPPPVKKELMTNSILFPEHVVSTVKGDPPGGNIFQEAKRDAPSFVRSASSEASSVSNAPTDEMTFEKVMDDTQKAVVNLFQQAANKRLIGDCNGKNESFDFHASNKGTPNKNTTGTPDTTGSEVAYPAVSTAYRPQASKSSLVQVRGVRDGDKYYGPAHGGSAVDKRHETKLLNETNQRGFATMYQGQEKEARNAKKGLSATATAANLPAKMPKSKAPPKAVGYGDSALDTSHIYGGDLFFESMFAAEAVPKPESADLQLEPTDVSQQTLLWTPSVTGPHDTETGELTAQRPTQAPINYVAASPEGHLSVTSEITGQLSMMTNPFTVSIEETRRKTINETPILPAAEHEADGNANVDRHSSMMACSTAKRIFGGVREQNNADLVVTENDDTSCVQNLHDISFEARFEALLSEDGEPYKKFRRKEKREKKTKKNLKAALDDLKFGLSTADIDECQKAAENDIDDDSCNFLADMFDAFVPSSYKPFAVGCNGLSSKQGRAPRGSATNSTWGSTSLSSAGSTTNRSQPRCRAIFPMSKAFGVTEEGVNSSTYWIQRLSGRSAVPEMPKQILTVVSSNVGNTEAVKRRIDLPTEKHSPEDEDEGNGGFEVYHIPATRTVTEDTACSPVTTPATRLLTERRTQLPPTYRGPVRDRTQPPQKVQPSNVAPKGGKRGPTKPKEAPNRVERKNTGLLSFLRKK
jgi:hypothetical protein